VNVKAGYVVAVLLFASVAGCGSSGGGGGGGGTSASDKSPIKIMSFFESTGVDALPLLPDGAQAAVAAVNKAGGINGRKLEWSSCDDKDTAADARACAQQAVSSGAIAVVGSDSLQNGEYLPVLAAGHVASFGSNPLQLGGDFTAPNSFPLEAGTASYPAAAGLTLLKLGATTISLAAIDIGNNSLEVALNAGLAATGRKVQNFVQVPAGAPDQAPYVTAALSGGTNGIVVWQQESDSINFLRQLSSSKNAKNTKVAVVSNDEAALFQQIGALGYGVGEVFNSYPTNQVSIPAVAQEVANFQAAGVASALTDQDADNAYNAVMAFADIAKKVKDLTPASFMTAVEHTSDLHTGLLPPLQFEKGNVDGIGKAVYNNCSLLADVTAQGVQLLDQQWVDPTTGMACASP
jgi:ABC-type branched-subunit amino acid transport system substrate-binding protein